MEHNEVISRRHALRKFGQIGLAATATAGLADLLGRPSAAKAHTKADTSGPDTCNWTLAVGQCNGACESGRWCYQATGSNVWWCCDSHGQKLPFILHRALPSGMRLMEV